MLPTVNHYKPTSSSYLSEVHPDHRDHLERGVKEAKMEQMDFQDFQVISIYASILSRSLIAFIVRQSFQVLSDWQIIS